MKNTKNLPSSLMTAVDWVAGVVCKEAAHGRPNRSLRPKVNLPEIAEDIVLKALSSENQLTTVKARGSHDAFP